jgi:hypothetical protein
MSAPMVRALLAGTKTQTRRVVKPQPVHDSRFAGGWKLEGKAGHEAATCSPLIADLSPYGQPGDRLWVREHWCASSAHDSLPPRDIPAGDAVEYLADSPTRVLTGKARRAFHMPRWASRITLEVTGVRVERLQDISEADAMAEGGVEALKGWWSHEGLDWNSPGPNKRFGGTAIDSYRILWEQINGPGSWDANPWVWCVGFKRMEVSK